MPVLVIVRDLETEPILPWAERFARARRHALVVLHPSSEEPDFRCPDLHAPDRVEPKSEELKSIFHSLRHAFPHPPPDGSEPLAISFSTVPAEDFDAEALAIIESERPELLLLPRPLASEGPVRRIFRQATCETVILDLGEQPEVAAGGESSDAEPSPFSIQRILVPTSSGANARFALSLACSLVGPEGEVEALFVEPPIGEEAVKVGEKILRREMRRALGAVSANVSTRVKIADDPAAGIIEVAREGDYDLVLVGATEGLSSPRMRKSSIPDRVRRGLSDLPVAVSRCGIPLVHRAERAIIRFFRAVVPQLSREERIQLVEKVQSSSSFNFDFITLVCLSTLIAGLGLIRDSAAVVIGAMLVAPLMTPLVGCGLALVHGNLILIRNAARSVFWGFCLSFAIGVGLGLLVPGVGWTDELLSRGEPGRLDLIVAFASGLAAAYATGRPGLSGALPGVAIAAALVPPIATTGIGVALGHYADALGALLLFLSNIVAIVLGAAISLYALGMRGEREPDRRGLWMRPVIATLILVCCGLTIALGTRIHAALDVARVPPELQKAIGARLAEDRADLRSIRAVLRPGANAEDPETIELILRVETPRPMTADWVEELRSMAAEDYAPIPVRVRVAATQVFEGGSE